MKISMLINGAAVEVESAADRRAVDLLREDMGLTGTKEGCGTGECGACTILVDGQTRLSCLTLASQLAGRRVTTIEGLAADATDGVDAVDAAGLHPVQQAFVNEGAVQCGFCTPGMILTATEFLNRHPQADRQEMTGAISGNICRCTGYQKIIDAMAAVEPASLPLSANLPVRPPPICRPSPQAAGRPVFFPRSLAEIWPLLAAHPAAKILAGGTDLLTWIRQGRANPAALISLDKLESLLGIEVELAGLRIGAATPLATVLAEPMIGSHWPILATALGSLGSPHIRRMGTLGGNIVTASPAGDSLPPLYVLAAEVELCSALGCRTMPIADFILGPGQTALAAGEILTAIRIPRPESGIIQHFEKVGLRRAMACAVASLAAMIEVSAEGRIQSARLAWGSVGPRVMRLTAVEEGLIGRELSRETLAEFLPMVRDGLRPQTDLRAQAAYRRQVAANLLLRLLHCTGRLPAAIIAGEIKP